MEKIRKKASIVGLATTALLVTIALSLFMQYVPMSKLLVYAQSDPDEYGNRIFIMYVNQYQDGEWCRFVICHYSGYTENMTFEIDANFETRVEVHVLINKTLAPTWQNARDYTRVYVNVSTICTDQLLSYNDAWTDQGDFWSIGYEQTVGNAWTPAIDTIYQVDLKYEAYY